MSEWSIAQFDVPVSEIDEVFPEIVLWRRKRNLHKWPPFWTFGFADQTHVRLAREPVPLARIAGDARAHHVFPSRGPTLIARHDVIQIELASIEKLAAVLAGVFVALEDIVARKFYFLFRKPVEHQKYDHARDTNLKRNGRDYLVIWRVCG